MDSIEQAVSHTKQPSAQGFDFSHLELYEAMKYIFHECQNDYFSYFQKMPKSYLFIISHFKESLGTNHRQEIKTKDMSNRNLII